MVRWEFHEGIQLKLHEGFCCPNSQPMLPTTRFDAISPDVVEAWEVQMPSDFSIKY